MAGYNPLSYFSFGKKKDATSTSATPAPSGRGREGAHATSRGASRARSEAVAPSPRGRAEAHHEEAEEHEPFLKVTKGNRGGRDAGERRAPGAEHVGGCGFAHLEPSSASGRLVASGPRFVEARAPHVGSLSDLDWFPPIVERHGGNHLFSGFFIEVAPYSPQNTDNRTVPS